MPPMAELRRAFIAFCVAMLFAVCLSFIADHSTAGAFAVLLLALLVVLFRLTRTRLRGEKPNGE